MNTTTIVFIVKEGHYTDDYYEDEAGNEIQTLKGQPVVNFVETTIDKANKTYAQIEEGNADNPPYDTYRVILAYWKHNKEVIPLSMLQGDTKEN